MRNCLPAVLLFLMLLAGSGRVEGLPAAPPPERVGLSELEARSLLQRHFGLQCGESRQEGETYWFELEGFHDGRMCPLGGTLGGSCSGLEWLPVEARVHREAWIAPVSGHLARNLVVLVALFSDMAPPASNTLHGVLVLSQETPRASRAAFGWYFGREVTPLSPWFVDATGDAVLDVLYTFESWMGPFGRVVARELWSFSGLSPVRVIATGESVGGIFTTSFEGVPLWRDQGLRDIPVVRGAFRFEEVLGGRPALGLFERALLHGTRSRAELWVLGDFGEGWVQAIAGADPMAGDTPGEGPDCSAQEVPPDAPIEVRRRLLQLEVACRMVFDGTRESAGSRPWTLPERLWTALAVRRMGLPVLALSVRERLSAEWPITGPFTLLLHGVLALADLVTVHDLVFSIWPRTSRDEVAETRNEALAHPILVGFLRTLEALRERVAALLSPLIDEAAGALPQEGMPR